jgi:uncharacterized protein involved in cysteine biosynthesis
MTPYFIPTLLAITTFSLYLTCILISDIKLERHQIARHKRLALEDTERNKFLATL